MAASPFQRNQPSRAASITRIVGLVWIGGAIFSAFLFSLAAPYTSATGLYAILLAWLARGEYRSILAR